MSEVAGDGADAVRDTYTAARETAREAMKVGQAQAARAADVAQDAAQSITSYVRARPIEAALIGLGGLVIASLLLRRR
jgi:ElaB/YqjD/DUF883 family membrane-anchored ribosome-binding protein